MTELLVHHRSFASEQSDFTQRLFEAVRHREEEFVQRLLKSAERQASDVDARDTNGRTCLGIASAAGDLPIVKILVQNGANVDKPDFYSETPLQYAAEFGHIDVVRYLLKSGADVSRMELDRLSALHIAACKGHSSIAKLLISNKCDVNILTRKGVSCLHCAVSNGHVDTLRTLLAAGANVNVRGLTSQRTPIFIAGEAGNAEMVALLLQHGAKVNFTDQYGMTPLNMVCNRRKSTIAKMFIEANAIVNLPDAKGSLPLHYIARCGDVDVARCLLNAGSKVDVLNKHDDSPLHLAIRMMHADVVELLVSHGCSTNICGASDEVRPLHVAVGVYNDVAEFERILSCLVDGGCELDAKALGCETALYRALDLGKADLAALLLQYGADVDVECPHGVTILNKACQRGMTEFVRLLIASSWQWRRERWLFQSGIGAITGFRRRNLGRLFDDDDDWDFDMDDVPLVLWNRLPLYRYLRSARDTPLMLQQCCRMAVRRALLAAGRRLFTSVDRLDYPAPLKAFLKLQTD